LKKDNKMMSFINSRILYWLGWKIVNRYPVELPKVVLIVIPHTSTWDFPLGLMVRSAIKADIKYIGKDSLFKSPFGWLFRALGGYPVDRSKRNNFVQAMVDIFQKEDYFHVVLAPEGTRKKVDKLKTGFYFIAKGAGVPIVMCKFDFGNRQIAFSEPFLPTENTESDFKKIDDYFRGVKGKNPELGYLYKSDKV
jgi:1-acyl-sn-glycerol-3-phosphate acyltransferase